MENKYVNIINGEKKEMTNAQFELSYIPNGKFLSDLFRGRNVDLKLKSKISKSTSTFQYEINYDNQSFNLIYLNLKNSGEVGEKYKKRFQISHKINYNNNGEKYYVIGSYNTSDKIIYIVAELSDFIKYAIRGISYSSFWIDFSELEKTYEQEENTWFNIRGKKIYALTSSKSKEYSDSVLMNKIFFDSNIIKVQEQFVGLAEETIGNLVKSDEKVNSNPNILTTPENINEPVKYDKQDHTYCLEKTMMKRNQKFREIVFERENYTCELCGTTETFTEENGKQYFEGHHIIMYNYESQQRYKYLLDSLQNISCLCPLCHKKIHHSDKGTIKKYVIQLFMNHKELLTLYDIDKLDQIFEDYNDRGEIDG